MHSRFSLLYSLLWRWWVHNVMMYASSAIAALLLLMLLQGWEKLLAGHDRFKSLLEHFETWLRKLRSVLDQLACCHRPMSHGVHYILTVINLMLSITWQNISLLLSLLTFCSLPHSMSCSCYIWCQHFSLGLHTEWVNWV